MNKVITIGRQYGSGGREIGQKVAEYYGIPFYDNELITRAAILQKQRIERQTVCYILLQWGSMCMAIRILDSMDYRWMIEFFWHNRMSFVKWQMRDRVLLLADVPTMF